MNSRFVMNTYKADTGASVHSRRRMMESQRQAEQDEAVKEENDPSAKMKLQALMEHFEHMDMKNGYRNLKLDREFALQERINARDLRIAHLGDRHFVMAQQQEKELQSLFDEDDIMRTQGQDSVTNRTEDIAERLKDELDERDHIDEDITQDEEVRGDEDITLDDAVREKEKQKEEELEKKNAKKKNSIEKEWRKRNIRHAFCGILLG